MFDYSIAHWATFFTAAMLLNLSPEPDMAFIPAQTAKGGISTGFSAMPGIWTGAFIHVIFAALACKTYSILSPISLNLMYIKECHYG